MEPRDVTKVPLADVESTLLYPVRRGSDRRYVPDLSRDSLCKADWCLMYCLQTEAAVVQACNKSNTWTVIMLRNRLSKSIVIILTNGDYCRLSL